MILSCCSKTVYFDKNGERERERYDLNIVATVFSLPMNECGPFSMLHTKTVDDFDSNINK